LTLAIHNYQLLMFFSEVTKILFVLAFGACIGSLVNVLVYRMPLGLGVVTPPSRCPSCETQLTWRENIPVFGWLRLLGKCRFCRSPISAEYPVVEAFVALLWAAVFLVLYGDDSFLGINWAAVRPEWATTYGLSGGLIHTWPILLVILTLFSCLVAMTLIDAKTCFIPLPLTVVPVVVAVVVHPLTAWWVQTHMPGGHLAKTAPGWVWATATPSQSNWWWIGGSIGAVVGLALANLLLSKGLIRRSFADYDAWEQEQIAKQAKEAEIADAAPGDSTAAPHPGSAAAKPEDSHPTDLWIQYPHARREVFKELIFLAPCIGLGFLGAAATKLIVGTTPSFSGGVQFAHNAQLWVTVLAGVLMGYLIGGGAVWAMRIFGTFAFGKEAIGLGDVHMMAAVGACLGWINPVLAFFGAAFLGVAWWLVGLIFRGVGRRAMPFGPYLAMGTVLVWFCRPLMERLLSWMTKTDIHIP
jgi:leader peptidase (prepilin peptidase)/N-methyltransferase